MCVYVFCISEVYTRKCLGVFKLTFYIEGCNYEDYLNIYIHKGSQQTQINESTYHKYVVKKYHANVFLEFQPSKTLISF